MTEQKNLKEQLERCERVLIGLGEEWKLKGDASGKGPAGAKEREALLDRAYQALYEPQTGCPGRNCAGKGWGKSFGSGWIGSFLRSRRQWKADGSGL